MANNFCRFLSNGYRFKSTGTDLTYQPCCWFGREINLIDNPNFDAEKSKISSIDNWTTDCESCRQIENSGAYGSKSPRLRSFDEIPDQSLPDNMPAWLELTIDITCNAACIMCGPWHSTTWRKQEIKFDIVLKEQMPNIVDPVHWLTVLEQKFSFEFVKSVSFLGGEPFESLIPLLVLQKLKQLHGTLQEVTVHFQTNGTIKPNVELMSLAAECKSVKFNISVDGVGPRFEYVRYPLKWSRLETVIDYVKGLELENLKFVCLATLNPLNLFYYDELEQWVQQTFTPQQFISLKPNKSVGNISLSQTPRSLRRAVLTKFGHTHPVYKLISNLEYRSPQEGLVYLDKLDNFRKSNWKTVFPEVVSHFAE